MSKRVYLPTEEDLREIQRIKESNKVVDINAYGYLVVKAIEKILVDKQNGASIENMDDYILNIPEIVYGICWVYPEEIKSFSKIRQDEAFCEDLLRKESSNSIYNLDRLGTFLPSVQFASNIVRTTIETLNNKLKDNPEYRFEYQESDLLNSIFSYNYPMFEDSSFALFSKLKNIDATYALNYGPKSLYNDFIVDSKDDQKLITHRKGIFFEEGLTRMLERYNLSKYCGYNYQNKDITKNDDEHIKRLKRFLTK